MRLIFIFVSVLIAVECNMVGDIINDFRGGDWLYWLDEKVT